MALAHSCWARAGIFAIAVAITTGCRSSGPRAAQNPLPPTSPGTPAGLAPAANTTKPLIGPPATAAAQAPAVRPASFPEPVPAPPGEQPAGEDLFAGVSSLAVQPLVDMVVPRNPSVEAMANAWRAAAERYPQVVALDDPVLMSMMAPASFASNTVQPGYVVGGSQKIPWRGKREARGRMAQAEANAAFHDIETTRLQVAEAARLAYYEYYLVYRQLELNADDRGTKQEFRHTAQSRYESNLVGQQDVLQADIALADADRRTLELERMRRVAVARINTLLLRAPNAPLPPPPARLDLGAQPAAPDQLRSLAVQRRPDLASLAAKIEAEQAAVTLAAKEFYPDVEVYGRYDSFWQPAATQAPLRPQVGFNMNVPIYRQKRYAALHEAEFRLSQRRAEYQQRLADIQFEVQDAYEQVLESRQTALLYNDKFLPAAEENLNVARTGYAVGRVNFLALLDAQQQLISVRDKQQQAVAEYYRRLAALERIVGGDVPPTVPGPT